LVRDPAREQDDRAAIVTFVQGSENFQTAAVGHVDVEQQQVGPGLP
jgi:hypothetical protein